MKIAPILYNSFAIKNFNNYQNFKENSLPFQAKIDRKNYNNLINSGYKLYKNNVPIISKNETIYGKTFVLDDNVDVIVNVTDNKLKILGHAIANLNKSEAILAVKNFYRGKVKHVATAAYDSLLEYIKINHPEIKIVKANIINENSYKFHIAYGFTNDYQKNVSKYNCKSMNNWLFYSLK